MVQINFLKDMGWDDSIGTFTDLSHDTRTLKKGDLFFDLIGCEDHCKQAVQKGAIGIITPLITFESTIPLYPTTEPRRLFSKACSLFYPKQPTVIAAVTGTNGKTSTVDFIRQLWEGLEKPAYSFGTLGLQGQNIDQLSIPLPTSLNTLDAWHLHRLLHAIASFNDRACFAFEASSHGLDQYRAHHVRVTHGVFTNLTQDHLDYHHTMTDYFEAKSRLFNDVMIQGGTAIINGDDDYREKLLSLCQKRNLQTHFFSMTDENAPLFARVEELHGSGMTVFIKAFDESVRTTLPFVGTFQISNLLGALGVVLTSSSTSLKNIAPFLNTLKAPEGRMEHVGTTQNGADVFIDYAHTPDALTRALECLKAHTQNHLHVIFGCGGDRDRTKRPLMGNIAARLADHVIITDDNPRTEESAHIRQEIEKGIGAHPLTLENIDGREKAIEKGISHLKKGDILLIAGKGHEQGQIIGKTLYPFCDKKIAQQYLI